MSPTLHPLPSSASSGGRDQTSSDRAHHGRDATLDEPPVEPSDRLRVVGWHDPVIDRLGYDPRSLYVELFWLGILGPTSTWLLRRLASGLDERPQGFDLHADVMARALGLGGRSGRHSPFQRALARCEKFELARRPESTTFAVRRRIPPLSRRNLMRLPLTVQESHRRWMAAAQRGPTLDETRRRARHLALRMFEAGENAQVVELELMRFGVHPAIAHEATVWATVVREDQGGHRDSERTAGRDGPRPSSS